MNTFRKTINGRKYECSKIPVLKQLKLMPILAAFEKVDKNDSSSILHTFGNMDLSLIQSLFEISNLVCEVGEREVPVHLVMDEHFEDLSELMELIGWVFSKCVAVSKSKK